MNKAALDAAFWTYCKATGLNPESHPAVEEAIRQAVEAYLEHANNHPLKINGNFRLTNEGYGEFIPDRKPDNG